MLLHAKFCLYFLSLILWVRPRLWQLAVDAGEKVSCIVGQVLSIWRHLLRIETRHRSASVWLRSSRLRLLSGTLTRTEHHVAADLCCTCQRLEARLHLSVVSIIVLKIGTWDSLSITKLAKTLLRCLVRKTIVISSTSKWVRWLVTGGACSGRTEFEWITINLF